MQKTHHRTCHLCEAMCGILITTEDGAVKSIKGDKDDPLSRGHICPKAVALQDIHFDKDRLKQPVKRTENGWEEISWKQAFEEVLNLLSGFPFSSKPIKSFSRCFRSFLLKRLCSNNDSTSGNRFFNFS